VCLNLLRFCIKRRGETRASFTGNLPKASGTREAETPVQVPGPRKEIRRTRQTKEPFRYRASVHAGGAEGENIWHWSVDEHMPISRTRAL